MWLDSGMLILFVGLNPQQTDPEAQEALKEGYSCARFPLTEEVQRTLEERGAVEARYGPFRITLMLESTYNRLAESDLTQKGA
jgi:hypothetical protein